jgi:hypothetical protein
MGPNLHSSKSTRELPNGYEFIDMLDLVQDQKLLITISLASLILFALFGTMFIGLLQLMRPDFKGLSGEFSLDLFEPGTLFVLMLSLLAISMVMVILHEAIHGLFFWLFTGGRIKYGFKGAYAYAAAPDWYIPRKPYLIVSLAPLVIITVVGFTVLLFVPQSGIFAVLLLITMNASGAAGDLYAFIWILKQPKEVLIQDFGERMKVYGPVDVNQGHRSDQP